MFLGNCFGDHNPSIYTQKWHEVEGSVVLPHKKVLNFCGSWTRANINVFVLTGREYFASWLLGRALYKRVWGLRRPGTIEEND